MPILKPPQVKSSIQGYSGYSCNHTLQLRKIIGKCNDQRAGGYIP